MQRIHLLRVEASPATFVPLFNAAAARRERLGWLDLEAEGPLGLPAGVGEAVSAGARPVAALGDGRVVTVRQMKGPPVLRDLLRRDFLGCRAVLVRGVVEAPLLEPTPEGWRVTPPGGQDGTWSREGLLDALARARPWR